MIQIYSAGALVYDSRLPGYDLLALSYTEGLNKAGTATIQMPPGHPSLEAFQPYKPVVTIYEDDDLVFRGRPLEPADDFYNRRTITCEGERCFFLDAAMRPYLYQAAPDAIFRELVDIYNSQVEPDKRFIVGTITVTDANDYIRLESESAEQVGNTIDKLVERCGGYIVFTTNENGDRVVNWYAEVKYQPGQPIEFGSNLLDFAKVTRNPELATRIIPYGAKNEETGERVTIESVNDGLDYVEDEEAIQHRGIIAKPYYWDDVTEPLNLKRKAEELLATRKNLITSLTLSAVDILKHYRKSGAVAGVAIADESLAGTIRAVLGAFRCGALVPVVSKPHQVDEDFLLTDREVDMLNPGASTLTLGKETMSLTGLHSTGSKSSLNELQRTERNIRKDYTLNIAQAVAVAQSTLTSLIEQTEKAIKLEVSETYTTNGEVESAISTSLKLLSDGLEVTFSNLKTYVDNNDASAREHIEEQQSYIRMVDGNIILGKNEADSMVLTLENDLIVFKKNGATFGWWDGVDFHTGNIVVEVNERAQFGNFAFVPRSNGSLSFLKVK